MAINIHALNDVIRPALTALGYELVGCESFYQGKRMVLRVYIDKTSGVTVDDCAVVSRQISAVLSVEEAMGDRPYTLEVSSPGLNRPLFNLEHFKRFVGSNVYVVLQVPQNGRRNYKGLLQKVDGEQIILLVDEHEHAFSIKDIKKAKLEPDF